MAAERFRGADIAQVADRARRSFGDDVMILHTRVVRDGGVPLVEVMAAPASTLDSIRTRMDAKPITSFRKPNGRPYIIALVGPTGAGKTTTAAKLAVRKGAFGAAKVGLITIDTYRVGGMEQLATYAELADVPFEVVYDAKEIDATLRRLTSCDVVIIDTPGRSPTAAELTERWRTLLDAFKPDETHLVLPATLRPDLATEAARAYVATRTHVGTTHLLLTKLDEVPRELGVTDLALSMQLPVRWIADGQDVPADLKPGTSRILRGYGLSVDVEADWVHA